MHVISRKKLREFVELHPDADASLYSWWKLASTKEWSNLQEVRQDWPTADAVGGLTIFNISGNKYRLVASIKYDRKMIYVRAILTHAEYDRGRWKNDPYY
jgi:mRNA interferase HigB